MINYSLTREQQDIFNELIKVLVKCDKSGIYLWDNYGTISAVNGNVVECVASDDTLDKPLNSNMVEWVSPSCWKHGNADDPLYVSLKKSKKGGGDSG
jgi:hypothetical protein